MIIVKSPIPSVNYLLRAYWAVKGGKRACNVRRWQNTECY